MKILIVTHYFLPHIGGIEIVAYNQAKELVKKGHTVTIVTSKILDEKVNENIDNIKILRVPAWNILEKKLDIPFPIFMPQLVMILNQEIKKNDIIHAHGALYLGSFFSSILSKIYKKPFVLTEHVGFVKYKNSFINFLEKISFLTIGKITLDASKKIFVLNNNTKLFLMKITNRSIEYLSNGVDTDLFKPVNAKQKMKLRKKYSLPINKKIVLFVGRFVQKKGIEFLINAKTSDFDLVLVGEGKLPKKVNNIKGIFVLDPLSQESLSEIYQACDVFVLPSTGEGLPLSIQEAMASGLPIITTNQKYYKEIFDTNFVTLIEQNVKQIKSNLKELLKNTFLMKKMRNYSRTFVVNKFSWNIHTNKLLQIYEEVGK